MNVPARSVRSYKLQALMLAILCILSIIIIVTRFELTVDLGYFLPTPITDQEKVLVDRLGQGPGSWILFISVPLVDGQSAIEQQAQLSEALLATGLFSKIISGDADIGITAIPASIREDRYLLNDVDLSEAGLRAALLERRADMAVIADEELLSLIAEDPYLASVSTLEKLSWSGDGDIGWISPDGQTLYLVAETVAPSFDIAAQTRAVETIEAIVSATTQRMPELHGVGAYGVSLQDVIKTEAQQRTVLAVAAIIIVLLFAYRRWQVIWLASIPLAIGALTGLAAVALLFGRIHGITLAFGFTLFGVAVDYPLHLLSHMRRGTPERSIELTWPTLRLGAVSTIIAYLALTISGSTGLAQLGVFSATGIVVTLYTARYILPVLYHGLPEPKVTDEISSIHSPKFRHTFWIAGLLMTAMLFALLPRDIWNNDLGSMSPIAPEKLRRDRELRLGLGAPDIRYLVMVIASSRENVLQETERLEPLLIEARRQNWLDGYQLITTLVPSQMTRDIRHAHIVNAAKQTGQLQRVMQNLSMRPEAFQPFLDDLHHAAKKSSRAPVDGFADTSLQDLVNSQVYFDGDDWISLTTLFGLHEPGSLAQSIEAGLPAVTVVDLKAASESLIEQYRQRVLLLLGAAFLVIVGFLRWRIGSGSRLLWVCGTLLSTVFLTSVLTALVLGQLSLFSLFATVLVAGLGLDYALFTSRTEVCLESRRDTLHALTICASSTLLAFLILGFSSVPILQAIGVTVAIGVALNYVLTLVGSRQ